MDCVGYCCIISFVCDPCPVSRIQNVEMETEASLFSPLVQPIYMLRYGFMWTVIRCGQILKLLVLSTRIQFGSFLYKSLS